MLLAREIISTVPITQRTGQAFPDRPAVSLWACEHCRSLGDFITVQTALGKLGAVWDSVAETIEAEAVFAVRQVA